MERSVGRSGRPVPDSWVERPQDVSGGLTGATDDTRTPTTLLLLLAGEIAAFVALTASGNMPEIVSVLFRALLTL